MSSFMELIYIDSKDLARQTNMRHALETDAETWAAFNKCRRYAVNIKQANFLLDYHNRKGDLSDTIPLDAGGFVAITGHQPMSDAAYRKLDAEFWRDVQGERKRAA